MPDLPLDDITLHYEVDGNGPPLLLLAGMLSDSASWTPLVDPFSKDHTLIRPDNRTTGRTTPWNAPVSLAQMAHDALGLMDHLGHDRFHVAGHSMGGRAAIELAALAQSRIASLTIMASSPQKLPRSLAVFDSLCQIRATPDGETLWLKALYPWVFGPAFFEIPTNARTALVAALAYPHAQSREAMAHQIDALRDDTPTTELADLACPAQVLYAQNDVLIPPGPALAAFDALPRVVHHIIPNAGHSIHWDAPDAVALYLRDFMQAHPA
ncbi:alpha/beta fold hydrolase [Aestuariivita sp.]|jgi:pimeloyl-ACP methyl ester carboxylesterase|uniref:alpha/beta fold hydrolase n=1 Tax=Aestuariivita sp. TaxID=1872407 RepID=UPI00216C8BC3|nr:alpha/beta fold hydrolase [Aestuariivita sp.]MCE8007681.1 alpha/beta fold hydrolase [Aestuariivita sp.]